VRRRNTRRARRRRGGHQGQLLQQLQSRIQPRVCDDFDWKWRSCVTIDPFDCCFRSACGSSGLDRRRIRGIGSVAVDWWVNVATSLVCLPGKLIPCAYMPLFTGGLEGEYWFLMERASAFMAGFIYAKFTVVHFKPCGGQSDREPKSQNIQFSARSFETTDDALHITPWMFSSASYFQHRPGVIVAYSSRQTER
jgi:hypothetical protein